MTHEATIIEPETQTIQSTELQQMPSPSNIEPTEPKSDMMQFMLATKDLDLDKLEKFMALYERDQARKAEQEFYRAFPLMKAELPLILQKHYNTQTKSNYAKLDDISVAVDPILSKHGFAVSFNTVEVTAEGVTVDAVLSHSGSHKISNRVWMPLDNKGIAGTVNKTGPHAISSSITYAQRVGLKALLGVATGKDLDGNGPRDENEPSPYITTEQAIQIDQDLKDADIDRKQFFEWAKATNENGELVEDSRYLYSKNLKKIQQVIADKKKEIKKASVK